MSTSPSVIKKPVMRGLLITQIKRNIIVALTLSVIGGFTFRELVGKRRKQKYAEYYRTLDCEAQFEEMRKKGLFQSC